VEAKEVKRQEYLEQIKDITKDKLVFIDESGIEVGSSKARGWGRKGKILHGKKSGKYYERINIVAGYVNKRSIAPLTFTGPCNRGLFEAWVEQGLIKELQAGQYIILDNAAFHKSKKVKKLIESVGCKLIFLPPYSPDLNPIEKFWANMKKWIKEKLLEFTTIEKTITEFFLVLNLN
jgi:transposase